MNVVDVVNGFSARKAANPERFGKADLVVAKRWLFRIFNGVINFANQQDPKHELRLPLSSA